MTGYSATSEPPRYSPILALTVVALTVLCAATPAQAQNCKYIPLQVTIHSVPYDPLAANGAGGHPGLYGDAGALTDSVYTDGGPDGVYAKFVLCKANSPTYKFVMNLNNSTRFVNLEFSRLLTSYDTGTIVPGTSGAPVVFHSGVLGIDQVPNLSAYLGGQLNTWGNAASINPISVNTTLIYCNQFTVACTGSGQQGANKYSDTSILLVTVAPGCSSWTITPQVPSPGVGWVSTNSVAGLIEAFRRGNLSAGDYSMPFSLTITRTDGGGCTGLP